MGRILVIYVVWTFTFWSSIKTLSHLSQTVVEPGISGCDSVNACLCNARNTVISVQHFTDSNCWLFLFSTELSFGKTHFYRTDIEGEQITLGCPHTVYSKEKFLCKGECKTVEDIIIETDGNRAQSGRYHIIYLERSIFGLYVKITNVSKSDTGWYQCGYGRPLSPHSSNAFTVLVIDGKFLLKSWTLHNLLNII